MTKTSYTFNDSPAAAAADAFGFDTIAVALADIIGTRPHVDTPLTIGIYGPWGSGKTTLMKMLSDKLASAAEVPGSKQGEMGKPAIGTVTAWFDAWRYARHEQALWRALLICVVEEIRRQLLGPEDKPNDWVQHYAASKASTHANDASPPKTPSTAETWRALNAKLDDLIDSLYRTVDRDELGKLEFDWKQASILALRSTGRIGLGALTGGAATPLVDKAGEAAAKQIGEGEDIEQVLGILRRQRSKIYRDQIQSLEQFYHTFKELIEDWFTSNGQLQQRLVIFVDDLDRCMPEDSVGVLEAIKVFFDIPGCVVVLGIDHDIVARGIRHHYRALLEQEVDLPLEGRDYLEKIVQIPIFVPLLREKDISPFLRKRLDWLTDDKGQVDTTVHDQVLAAFYSGLPRNPRIAKRAMNMLVVLDRLARASEGAAGQRYSRPLMAKLVVLRYRYPRLYDYLSHSPRRLIELEEKANGATQDPTLGEFALYIKPAKDPYKQAQISAAAPELTAMLGKAPYFKEQGDTTVGELIFLTSLLRSNAA